MNMQNKDSIESKIEWCETFLKRNNISAYQYKLFLEKNESNEYDIINKYTLTYLQDNDLYDEMAIRLRELWPNGMKDGKFSWRDSVYNISARLKYLFEKRNLKDKTLDDVLACARYYLSRNEDMKYLKLLKFFILKKETRHGFIQEQSILADMLEGKIAIPKIESYMSDIDEQTYDNTRLV